MTDLLPIKARFVFLPDRASEFIEEEGRLVQEMEFETIEEVVDIVEDFKNALEDCNVLINGQVINLADFTEEV